MSRYIPPPVEPKMVALDMPAIRDVYCELVAEHTCGRGEPACSGRVVVAVAAGKEIIHVNPTVDGTFAFIHGRASCVICGKEDSFTIGPVIEVDEEMVQNCMKLMGKDAIAAREFLDKRNINLKSLGMRLFTRQQYKERAYPPYKNGKKATWQPDVADQPITVEAK